MCASVGGTPKLVARPNSAPVSWDRRLLRFSRSPPSSLYLLLLSSIHFLLSFALRSNWLPVFGRKSCQRLEKRKARSWTCCLSAVLREPQPLSLFENGSFDCTEPSPPCHPSGCALRTCRSVYGELLLQCYFERFQVQRFAFNSQPRSPGLKTHPSLVPQPFLQSKDWRLRRPPSVDRLPSPAALQPARVQGRLGGSVQRGGQSESEIRGYLGLKLGLGLG